MRSHANPGDGVCTTDAGECTLRADIQEANVLAGADTIELPVGTYVLTIPGQNENLGATGDLDIIGTLTIVGEGAETTIIDGNSLDRVFHIHFGANVTVSGVTVHNGNGTSGGGIFIDEGRLTLINSAVSGNTASLSGGGIFNDEAILTLTNSTVSGNTVNAGGGGVYNDEGTVTITNSIVSDNIANAAGGIFNDFGTLTLIDSSVSNNRVIEGFGGGIAHLGFRRLTLTNSTVSGNEANVAGGGIFKDTDPFNMGTATLTNSTLSSNMVREDGGAISVFSGIINVNNVTITNNTADGDNNGSGNGGGIHNPGGTVNFKNCREHGPRRRRPGLFWDVDLPGAQPDP